MKTIFSFLLISIPFFLLAQPNSSIDFVGGIDYTYRSIDIEEGSHFTLQTIKEGRASEKGNINWQFGVNYNQKVSKQLFLRTGIRLTSLGYHENIDFSDLRWGQQHDGNGSFDPNAPSGEDFNEYKISSNFWFVKIPVVLRYELNSKKIAPYIEAGFGAAYYLGKMHVSTLGGETDFIKAKDEINSELINRFQLEGIVAFGVNYNLRESIQLFGQPTFRYHLTKMWDTDLKEHLWATGLEIGLRKKLN